MARPCCRDQAPIQRKPGHRSFLKRVLHLGLAGALGLLSACSRSDNSRTTLLRVVRTLPSNEVVTSEASTRDRELVRNFQTHLRVVVPGLRVQP